MDAHVRRAAATSSRESATVEGGRTDALVGTPAGEARFLFPFTEAHNLTNALCAIAVGVALEADLADLAAARARR